MGRSPSKTRGSLGSFETDEEATCAGSLLYLGMRGRMGVYQGAMGPTGQSAESPSQSPGSRLTSAINKLSDRGPVTPLAGPSFPPRKVTVLAQLISKVRAESEIRRFPSLMFQARTQISTYGELWQVIAPQPPPQAHTLFFLFMPR